VISRTSNYPEKKMTTQFRNISVAITLLAISLTPSTLASTDDPADTAMSTIRPDALRADIRFLSDDSLEGRGTATRGHQIAAKFMATQFEGLGLQPAGDANTYFQNVPLRSMHIDSALSTLTILRNGKSESLTFGQDFLSEVDPGRPESSIEAPVVFVGYGVTAPEQNYDDYKGADVRGKIVAMFYGAPNFESSLKAHFSSFDEKNKIAVDHGAVGIIVFDDPTLEQMYPFSKIARDARSAKFTWLDKQGQPSHYFPQLKGNAIVSLPEVKKLFEGAPQSADEAFAAKAGKLTSFPLPFTVKIQTITKSEDVQSPNVVAQLQGSDPALKNENVVYTAHLDHLGIGPAVDGDTIYNGALDNASGSAALLSLARAFSSMNPKPRRSILFVVVTGEEAGLLGSDYFATYPTLPKNSLVADINIDEILMLWPLKDVIAFGAEHSSLQNDVVKATERLHLTESPDPMPEEVVFIRSDQYSFVKQGIPSVMLSPGFQSSDPNSNPTAIFQKWEETRYHQPQDDINQPGLDFEAGVKLVRLAFLCGYSVAQSPTRPAWNKSDFFGDHYAHKSSD
jgi:hypothetical protein